MKSIELPFFLETICSSVEGIAVPLALDGLPVILSWEPKCRFIMSTKKIFFVESLQGSLIEGKSRVIIRARAWSSAFYNQHCQK